MENKSTNFFVFRVRHSDQCLVAAILDLFKMAASENEGIYFVSNILIESHEIFNGSDV